MENNIGWRIIRFRGVPDHPQYKPELQFDIPYGRSTIARRKTADLKVLSNTCGRNQCILNFDEETKQLSIQNETVRKYYIY